MSGPALSSTATVVSAKAERYAKQLVAHLGHKLEFRTDGRTSTAAIGTGTGHVVVNEGGTAVTLLALADDAEALGLVEHVLGSHLERFAQRDELTVSWTRSGSGG